MPNTVSIHHHHHHYYLIYNRTTTTLTCIERIPRILFINSQSNPLCHNFLFSFIDWTSTVFGKSIVGYSCLWVHITKEYGSTRDRFDMYTRVVKVSRSTVFGNSTIDNHGSKACSSVMRHARTVSVAMLKGEMNRKKDIYIYICCMVRKTLLLH